MPGRSSCASRSFNFPGFLEPRRIAENALTAVIQEAYIQGSFVLSVLAATPNADAILSIGDLQIATLQFAEDSLFVAIWKFPIFFFNRARNRL